MQVVKILALMGIQLSFPFSYVLNCYVKIWVIIGIQTHLSYSLLCLEFECFQLDDAITS